MGDPRRRHRRPGEAGVRAARRRVPEELVAERDQHRRPEVLPRADGLARARALGQADGRPRGRHDRRLGARGRLLRDRRPTATRSRPSSATSWSTSLQRSTPGLVQRRLRGAAAVLGVLHPLRRGHDGVDPRLEHQGGNDLPRRFRLGHQPLQDPLVQGAALQGRARLRAGVVHARRRRVGGHDQVRRQDAARGQDGRARRRPPGHPRVHLVQGQGGGQGRRARRGRLRHVDRRRGLPLDPVPEREQLGPSHRRVPRRGRERRRVEDDRAGLRRDRSTRSTPAT